VPRPVTDAFKESWRNKLGQRDFVKVKYKRRYWNGSAFVYEANFHDLDDDDIVEAPTIPMQLDVPRKNVYTTSMVSLKLENKNNQWLQGTAPPSLFAADATATLGYRLFKTIIQVQFGYLLEDGTKEYTAIFTGLTLRGRPTGSGSSITLNIASRGLLLEKSDAEKVSLTFTLEDAIPATGDGSNTEFETTSTGVDHLDDVQVNAVSKDQGSEWTVSNTNMVAIAGNTGRALITFSTAPSAGHTVKSSGVKWKQGQFIESLVADLCEEAGITSGERAIQAVLFPGGLSGSFTIDSQADWNAAGNAKTNVESESVAGDLRRKWIKIDDFADGDFTSNPFWVHNNEGVTDHITVVSSKLQINLSDASSVHRRTSLYTSFPYSASLVGTWRWKVTLGSTTKSEFRLYATSEDPNPSHFFVVRYSTDAGGTIFFSGLSASTSVIGVGTAGEHELILVRPSNATWEIYFDGVLQFTLNDPSLSLFNRIELYGEFPSPNAGSSTVKFDDIYYSGTTTSIVTFDGTSQSLYVSQEFDLLTTPVAWGLLERTATVQNGGAIRYYTKVATVSGGPYDARVQISSGGLIQSALKRYLKIEVEIDQGNNSQDTPYVQELVANFTVNQVVLALANHSGMTCFQAIQKYARDSNYEFGFDGDGTFFFRSKDPSTQPEIELTQENAIIDIVDHDDGHDRVANVGRFRHQEYVAEYDGADASEASPTSEEEFGRIVEEQESDLLFGNDISIASGWAQRIYEEGFRPKKRLRMQTWIVPWLELSDPVSVSFFDHPLLRETIAGDPLQIPENETMAAGEAENVLARSLLAKVIEYRPNLETNRCDMLVEEILS